MVREQRERERERGGGGEREVLARNFLGPFKAIILISPQHSSGLKDTPMNTVLIANALSQLQYANRLTRLTRLTLPSAPAGSRVFPL